jgi:oxygen-independent coproporphyrinogen-3 oxidase
VVKDRHDRHLPFVERLLVEIDSWSPSDLVFDTIYFGGGTPSSLAPALLERILLKLDERFRLQQPRISLEVNPEDVSRDSARAWRSLGVHTVSLGLQALDDAALRFLGRRHRRDQALTAVALVHAAGFGVVGLDLIYGLPDQSAASWRATLREAVALEPDHLSCYELTIHDGTPFGRWRDRGGLRMAVDAVRAELFEATHQELAKLGFEGYEVSNFARTPQARSRHNLKYWSHVPYLGLGPSAHSFDGTRRWWNRRTLESYLSGSSVTLEGPLIEEVETLGEQELRLETILFGMRTSDGLDLDSFARRFGPERRRLVEAAAVKPLEEGLLRVVGDRLQPTLRGMAVADALTLTLSASP